MSRYEKLAALAKSSPAPTDMNLPINNWLDLDSGKGVYRGYAFELPTDALSALITQVKLAVIDNVESAITSGPNE